MHAELILTGNVLTLDARSTRAEAIAVGGGRVLLAGSREQVMALRGPGTRVHDFGSATLLPGFNDTHAHMSTVGIKTLRPSLAGARSIADIQARLRELARATPKGQWIVTMPVGEPPFYAEGAAILAEGRMPTRQELDAAAPEHPVYLSSPGGYWGQMPCLSAMNSAGLKANGITRDTQPAAPGLTIERDAHGEPTGVFREANFVSVIELALLPAVPRFTPGDRMEALRRGQRMCHAKGTTSIYEGHGVAPAVIADFKALHAAGELTMRSHLVLGPDWGSMAEAREAMETRMQDARGRGTGDAVLRVSGVFIPSYGDTGLNGLFRRNPADLGWGDYLRFVHGPAEFAELAECAARNDLRVNTVVSDRLHDLAPVLADLATRHPIGERRWVMEHVSQCRAADVDVLASTGCAVTLIPAHFVWKYGHRFTGLPADEQALVAPAARLLERGAPVSAGTDAVPWDPLVSVWAMSQRKTKKDGTVLGPDGRLDVEAALRLITSAGAWLSFEENEKGTLEPGRHADIAVLKNDPLAADGDAILDNECIATLVGGRWVHGDP